MSGQTTVEALKKQFNLPILDYLSRSTFYRVLLKLYSDKDPLANSFPLMTDLVGIESMLPLQYTKLA